MTVDRSDCAKCGEWRDGPMRDCAACGYEPTTRPCGDPLGVCIYIGRHDGPHKTATDGIARRASRLAGGLA